MVAFSIRFMITKQKNVFKEKNIYVNLPVTPEGEPDWQFMEDYIKSLPYGDRI